MAVGEAPDKKNDFSSNKIDVGRKNRDKPTDIRIFGEMQKTIFLGVDDMTSLSLLAYL